MLGALIALVANTTVALFIVRGIAVVSVVVVVVVTIIIIIIIIADIDIVMHFGRIAVCRSCCDGGCRCGGNIIQCP